MGFLPFVGASLFAYGNIQRGASEVCSAQPCAAENMMFLLSAMAHKPVSENLVGFVYFGIHL